MKTAKFNLDLAKQGHPLVTRHEEKIISFTHICPPYKQNANDVILASTHDHTNKYFLDGRYNDNGDSQLDLLLDLETPWVKPLAEGDIIEAKLSNGKWYDRELVYIDKNNNAIIRTRVDADNVALYKPDSWRRKPKLIDKPKLDITITINGEIYDIEYAKQLINSL